MSIETVRDFWLFLHWFGLGVVLLFLVGVALELWVMDPNERSLD